MIKYQPAFVTEAADRFLLNMADFLSPAYRTEERMIGLGQLVVTGGGTRTDLLSDLEAIRRVMDGDFTGETGPANISYDAGAVLWDGGLTALMVIPVGSGSQAAIAGGRFLPAGAGFARNQVLSAMGRC